MDITLVEIIKDAWDKWNICATFFLSFISILLVYICSARVSDNKKKKEQQFNSLNYLTICTNRYLKHMLGIWSVVKTKRELLNQYTLSPEDNKRLKNAFQIITAPMINFKVTLEDYAFTVSSNPKILDYLLHYTECYSNVEHQIEMLNNESCLVLNNAVPQERPLQIAFAYIQEKIEESNLTRLEFSTCHTIYILNQLLREIQNYQKLNKMKDYVYIDIQGVQLDRVIEAEEFLDKKIQNPNWRNELIDPNENKKDNKNRLKFYEKLFSIKNINNHKVISILGIKIKKKIVFANNQFEEQKRFHMGNNDNKCTRCLDKSNIEYKSYSNYAEQMGQYTSIVGSVFYVALLTFFCMVQENWQLFFKILFASSYLLSVSAFIINEIFKMIVHHSIDTFTRKEWEKYYKDELPRNIIQHNINKYDNKKEQEIMKIWKWCFCISLLFGIVAVGVLVCILILMLIK